MVMMAEPLTRALSAIQADRATQATKHVTQNQALVVLLSPIGRPFEQAQAQRLAKSPGVIFICGRYEGIDQRFIDQHVDEQWSLGDFVLSGGEIAALAIIDAAVRLLPGALNHDQSSAQDSFQDSLSGLLDSPHYTRPETLNGQTVPAVLLSGNHANIARWRREQSLALTLDKRPDLIERARARGWLTTADERYLLTLTAP
jgi:tRNA (guanine37-N1)-methyltransferase